MLETKGYGRLPADLHERSVEELRAILVALQGQRVELVDLIAAGRDRRDEIAAELKRAKRTADEQLTRSLPPARGKTVPTAKAVAEAVEIDAHVLAAKERVEEHARGFALLGDQLGAVRSALRVADRLIETAVHGDDAGEEW